MSKRHAGLPSITSLCSSTCHLGSTTWGPHIIALSICSYLEVEMPALSRNEAFRRMLRSLQQLGYVGI